MKDFRAGIFSIKDQSNPKAFITKFNLYNKTQGKSRSGTGSQRQAKLSNITPKDTNYTLTLAKQVNDPDYMKVYPKENPSLDNYDLPHKKNPGVDLAIYFMLLIPQTVKQQVQA